MPGPAGHLNPSNMYKLIDLPYAPDALGPVISARTLEFHHGKHLKGYVDNLNKLIAGTAFETMPLEEIVRKASGPIFNNAGQTLNHNLYFTQFSGRHSRHDAVSQAAASASCPAPSGHLGSQIIAQWGSLEAFQEEFAAKGAGLFGSGWVWLAAAPDGTLSILQCPGADNPVTHDLKPILTFDVWEHAYYLDYQNRRPDHLKALWTVVDWEVLEKRYVK